LSPAVAWTHDGQDSWRPRRFLWASGGPLAGTEGLLILVAGDLVAAGYAVSAAAMVRSSLTAVNGLVAAGGRHLCLWGDKTQFVQTSESWSRRSGAGCRVGSVQGKTNQDAGRHDGTPSRILRRASLNRGSPVSHAANQPVRPRARRTAAISHSLSRPHHDRETSRLIRE
jgi:hypothetical protein